MSRAGGRHRVGQYRDLTGEEQAQFTQELEHGPYSSPATPVFGTAFVVAYDTFFHRAKIAAGMDLIVNLTGGRIGYVFQEDHPALAATLRFRYNPNDQWVGPGKALACCYRTLDKQNSLIVRELDLVWGALDGTGDSGAPVYWPDSVKVIAHEFRHGLGAGHVAPAWNSVIGPCIMGGGDENQDQWANAERVSWEQAHVVKQAMHEESGYASLQAKARASAVAVCGQGAGV